MVNMPAYCTLVLLLVAVASVTTSAYVCRQDLFGPRADTLVTGVRLKSSGGTVKRQVVRDQPIRVDIQYDTAQLDPAKLNLLQGEIFPRLLSFLAQTLSVPQTTSPILLDRNCTTPTPGIGNILLFGGEERYCAAECTQSTMCGVVAIPEDHLKQCRQCEGENTTLDQCNIIGNDGAGVSNADFVLYVSADDDDNSCLGNAQLLAFASSCQLEAELDRPIAGNIHYCPSGFAGRSTEFIYQVTKHELLHALGFSAGLFPFWRDADGMPRTPRTSNGQPPIVNGQFQASESTLRQVTYDDWQTRATIPIQHTVTHLVTPRVLAEARDHYGCPTLQGVELENQGGSGTAISHWEKRIVGSEAMSGQFTFNPGFSRMTFALLEDSGWYDVDYSLADELVWGRNAGCRFATGSCGEWIQTQQSTGLPIAPFCNYLQGTVNPLLGCTFDREGLSVCNARFTDALSAEYQYFNDGPNFESSDAPRVGSAVEIADFCPFHDEALVSNRGGACADVANAPPSVGSNTRLEVFGTGSRCVEHGRQWSAGGLNVLYGSGCYEYECSLSGVDIIVSGQRFSCECEGQEFVLDITNGGRRFRGSILCPSCAQICHDQLDMCPNPEPESCYGTIVDAVPTVSTATAPTGSMDSAATVLPAVWALLVATALSFTLLLF